jgi:diguanylate cyclase (GGDEF)-like protein
MLVERSSWSGRDGEVAETTVNADVAEARGSFRRSVRLVAIVASVATTVIAFVMFWVASQVATSGVRQALLAALALPVLSAPTTAYAVHVVVRHVAHANALADQGQLRLDVERRHRDLESKIADALEMAEDEPEALRVIERTLGSIAPAAMTELLLADNSHAHLSRKAVAGDSGATGCGVDSPHQCPAARRARTHRFVDSDEVNACPKLSQRPSGRCAAVCIPVSVMGRTVGVIHSVTSVDAPMSDAALHDLHALANHAGARLGMLRVMSESQLQAATDSLTGLANRRAFENSFVQLRDRSPHASCVIVMADLDLFKTVNDTYGHETGDRALRVFADTLRRAVRSNDLVARRGGEEFAVALPDCDIASAREVLERVQLQLQHTVQQAGLPSFTASFGMTPGFLSEDLDLLLARADAGLFEAKRSGRDKIVVFSAADLDGASERDRLLIQDADRLTPRP